MPAQKSIRPVPIDGEVVNMLRTCGGLVSDMANFAMSLTSLQQVRNKLTE